MANMQNQNTEKNRGNGKDTGRNFQNQTSNKKADFQRQSKVQDQDVEQDSDSDSEQTEGQSSFQKLPLKAISALVTSELVTKFAAPIVDEIREALNERFGEESVNSVISTLTPSFPEGFDLSTLTDWEPIKTRISKNPIGTAAVAALGVGALYLARETMAGRGIGKNLMEKAMSFQSTGAGKTKKAPKRKAVATKRAKARA